METKQSHLVLYLLWILFLGPVFLTAATRGMADGTEDDFNWNAVLVSIVSQNSDSNPTPTPPPSNESCSGSEGFVVCSTSFTNGGTLDEKYTLYGNNISPQLSWKNPPAGTAAYGIYVYDADATDPDSGGNWVHWMVKVPGTTTELAENAGAAGGGNLPSGSVRFDNSFKDRNVAGAAGTDYDGPRPPSGTGEHRYYFKVDALDSQDQTIRGGTAYLMGKYSYQAPIDPPAPPDN